MKKTRNVLAMVRQALTCNQEDMAGYLELSRAEVGNAQTGKRFLPSEASLKVASLYMLIHHTPMEEEPPPAEPVTSSAIKNYRFKMEHQLAPSANIVKHLNRGDVLPYRRLLILLPYGSRPAEQTKV